MADYVNFARVRELPEFAEVDTIYFVQPNAGDPVRQFITGDDAVPVEIAAATAAQQLFDAGLIDAPTVVAMAAYLTGPSGTLTIGTVTTGAPGSAATVTNRGTPTDAVWDITIPRGLTGDVTPAAVAAAATAVAAAQIAQSAALAFVPPVAPTGRWTSVPSSERAILFSTIRPGGDIRFSCTGATTYALRYERHPLTTEAPVFDVYQNGVSTGGVLALDGPINEISTITIASGLVANQTYAFQLRLRGLAEYDPRWVWGAGPQIFDVQGGVRLPDFDTRPRDLWLGDSITGGVGGRYPGTGPYTSLNSAGDVCYSRLASELSSHSPTINGFGGSSLANTSVTGSGGVPCYWPGSRVNSPAFYYRNNLPIGKETFARIFINLGTNDSGGGVSDADFKAAMIAFCTALKQDHPEATIYVIRPFGGFKARPALEAALTAQVGWIDTFGLDLTYTDGIHPDVAGHLKAGQFINNWLTTPKVFTNGDFSNPDLSMWLKGQGSGTFSIVGGAGKITGFASYCQGFTTVIGQTYTVEATCGGSDPYLQKGDDPTAQVNPVTFSSGVAGPAAGSFVATSSYSYIVLTAFTNGTFDNIQIRNGPKLFTNGDFSNPDLSMWPGSGAPGFVDTLAIVNGKGSMTGQSQVAQSFTTVIGQNYSVSFERSGTDPYVQIGNNPSANPAVKTWTPGTSPVNDSFTATSTTTYVVLSTFTDGVFDNITIS